VSVFETDILNGATEFNRGSSVIAERRLMAAMLADALDCYRKHMFTANVRRRKLFRDAERWIDSDEYWLFSFRNVCEVLEIEPDAIRSEVRRWRRQQFLVASSAPRTAAA
jgi:hypothetical protein